MPEFVSRVRHMAGYNVTLPLGRSGCELGECSSGDCAVIVSVWVVVVEMCPGVLRCQETKRLGCSHVKGRGGGVMRDARRRSGCR
jgi:hypothetical protein